MFRESSLVVSYIKKKINNNMNKNELNPNWVTGFSDGE